GRPRPPEGPRLILRLPGPDDGSARVPEVVDRTPTPCPVNARRGSTAVRSHPPGAFWWAGPPRTATTPVGRPRGPDAAPSPGRDAHPREGPGTGTGGRCGRTVRRSVFLAGLLRPPGPPPVRSAVARPNFRPLRPSTAAPSRRACRSRPGCCPP